MKIKTIVIFLLMFFFSFQCFAYNAVITWKTVSGSDLAGYILYESNDGINFKKKLTLQATATSIVLHNLSKYVTVYWRLASFDTSGNISNMSNTVLYKR